MNPARLDPSEPVTYVEAALDRTVTHEGATLADIVHAVADLGDPLTDEAVTLVLEYLTEALDRVRKDGDRYFWWRTDTGLEDPYGPPRQPQPKPARPARSPRTVLMHLAECEPWKHPSWPKTTHGSASAAGAVMCDQTQYMADEMFPDEEVWTEQQPAAPADTTPVVPAAIAQITAAVDQAVDLAVTRLAVAVNEVAVLNANGSPLDKVLPELVAAADEVLDLFGRGAPR